MEYLDIEIFNHFLRTYSYIIWNGKQDLGEISKDDIMKVLDKNQIIDFYYVGKIKFKVPKHKIEKYLNNDF